MSLPLCLLPALLFCFLHLPCFFLHVFLWHFLLVLLHFCR